MDNIKTEIIEEPIFDVPRTENLRLKDGTILEVKQSLVGNEFRFIVSGKSLSECEELLTTENISRVSLFDDNGEYAVFAGYNATVITKDIEGVIHVTLLAKTPDRVVELENQLLNTQEALADIFEALEV